MNRTILPLGPFLICAETKVMAPLHPQLPTHVREAAFFFPRFHGEPTVTATLSFCDKNAPALAVYKVTFNWDDPNRTEIAIAAQTIDGSANDLTYLCHVHAIGQGVMPIGSEPIELNTSPREST